MAWGCMAMWSLWKRSTIKLCLVHGVSEMGPSEVQWHKRQFECKRCRGEVPQVDSAEQEVLVVDRETYRVVDSFCYLGDMLNADGGVDLAVTARVCSGWKKFRELPIPEDERTSLLISRQKLYEVRK